ncbi:MAG: PA2169 family four-helix-bundle protein [Pseudomonadota bacterium]
MLNNEDTVSVLNNLIEISKDGEEGFMKASQEVDNQNLKSYLMRRSTEVKQSVAELQRLVIELGGKPADSSSVAGYLHRRWIDLKTAIVDNDNLAVLNELERGEDVALRAYKEASQKELPVAAAHVVLRQLNGTQRNHDEVKKMRDTAEAVNKLP